MGGFKPKFQGVRDDYYPATTCEIISVVLLVSFICIGSLGMMIGFLYWEFAVGIKSFVDVWIIVLCVFIGLLFIGIYFGGRSKISETRKMIQEKLADEKRKLEHEKQVK
jgi:hypothetical protein